MPGVFKDRRTYNHFAGLAARNPDTEVLDGLHIVKATEDFVLHLEGRNHRKLRTGLDLERLVLELLLKAWRREVDDNRRSAGRLHAQRQNDTDTRIVGIREIPSAAQTERLFVPLQGLVVLV